MDDPRPTKKRRTEPANTFGVQKLVHTSTTGQLFIIHLTPEMIASEKQSYLYQCFETFIEILKLKLAQNKRDWMGLVLCNVTTEGQKNSILEVQKFGPVNIDMYQKVMDFYNEDIEYYTNLISSETLSLSDVLRYGSREYGTTITFADRKVVLFTSVDNPSADDPDEQHQIRVWANNYKTLKIKLLVVEFGDESDPDRFYMDITKLTRGNCYKSIDLHELQQGIAHRAHVSANLDLRLAENSKVRVAIQNFVSQRAPMQQTRISTTTNEPLRSHQYTKFYNLREDEPEEDADNDDDFWDETVQSSDIMSQIECGGKNLLFRNDKLKMMRKSRERGIDIIGFKEKPVDLDKLHINHIFFVGCHCSATDPQTQFFATLLSRMIRKNVIALCAVTLRDFVESRIWALSPCEEYGGFYLCRIPFKEEVRARIPAVEAIEANDNQRIAIKKIIQSLRLGGPPIAVSNPRLLKERKIVESLALDLPRDELPGDDTLPHEEMTERLRTRGLVDKFRQEFGSIYDEVIRTGSYESYTVAKLKLMLVSLGLPTTGKKADLVERINQYRQEEYER